MGDPGQIPSPPQEECLNLGILSSEINRFEVGRLEVERGHLGPSQGNNLTS